MCGSVEAVLAKKIHVYIICEMLFANFLPIHNILLLGDISINIESCYINGYICRLNNASFVEQKLTSSVYRHNTCKAKMTICPGFLAYTV